MDVFGDLSLNETIFLFRVRLLNKWKCTDECYLCLLAQLFVSSTLLPLHQAVDDVQFVSVFETSSHGSKGNFSP